MRLAATTRSFTLTIIPSRPSATWAALKISGLLSGEHSSTSPAAVTSVNPATWVDNVPKRAPVPCVPVLIAPAMLWLSISPRFSCASPCAKSASPSSLSRVPPQTVTVPASLSMDSIPCRLSSEISTSSVSTRGTKEWPAPTTRMCLPVLAHLLTSWIRSLRLWGLATISGRPFTEPDQLLHCSLIAVLLVDIFCMSLFSRDGACLHPAREQRGGEADGGKPHPY